MVPPIVWLGIVGIAATGMSMGFLMPQVPNFNLQGVSVNEQDFAAPVQNANVDIDIHKVKGIDLNGNTVFKNRITECSFHTPDTGMGHGSTVICKLTDKDNKVVAEGRKTLVAGFAPSNRYTIPIDQTAFPNANEVQNIDDIKIILLGTNPTCGGTGQPACTSAFP